MMKKILIITILSFSSSAFSQGVGVGTESPQATLDVQAFKTDGTTSEGMTVPHFTGAQLHAANDNSKYGTGQNGTIVYVTEPESNPSGAMANVVMSGYYYYDAPNNAWKSLDKSGQPWYSTTTNVGATSNSENIYHMASVGVGTTTPDKDALLDVYANDKGILLPRIGTTDRNNIPGPATGLLIYNPTTKCYSYYVQGSQNTWLSLCGDEGPAKFSLVNCDAAGVGPSGVYTAGTPLQYTNNTYTIVVNVSKTGSYSVTADTGNGYLFTASGVFTSTGLTTVVLEGQGKPNNSGTDHITILKFNGEVVTPGCTLPSITVRPSEPTITIYCKGIIVNGDYKSGIALTGSNYITVPVTEVVTPGTFTFTATTTNGYSFTYTGAVNAGTTSVTLTGSGTPYVPQTDNLTLSSSGGTVIGGGCNIPVTVTLGLGGFDNPADRCMSIYTSSNSLAASGEYWVKTAAANNTPVKTYCYMVPAAEATTDRPAGGYTLIWSYSEKTAYSNDTYNPGATNSRILTTSSTSGKQVGLRYDLPQNVVNLQAGTINYYNYRVSKPTMTNVESSTTPVYIIRIAENATNMSDPWAALNYINITINSSSYNPISATGNEYSQGAEMNIKGLIFGRDFTRNGCTKSFNGTQITTGCGSDPAFYTYQTGSFPNHINWSGASAAFTPITPSGNGDANITLPFSTNLFGVFANDSMPNHHFGKCGNTAGSETSFSTTNCSTNLVPHSSINGGEGRVLQWFVK